eukprot:403347293
MEQSQANSHSDEQPERQISSGSLPHQLPQSFTTHSNSQKIENHKSPDQGLNQQQQPDKIQEFFLNLNQQFSNFFSKKTDSADQDQKAIVQQRSKSISMFNEFEVHPPHPTPINPEKQGSSSNDDGTPIQDFTPSGHHSIPMNSDIILDENIQVNYHHYIPHNQQHPAKLLDKINSDSSIYGSASKRLSINVPNNHHSASIQSTSNSRTAEFQFNIHDSSQVEDDLPLPNKNIMNSSTLNQSNSKVGLVKIKENLNSTIQNWQKDWDQAVKQFNSFISPPQENSCRKMEEIKDKSPLFKFGLSKYESQFQQQQKELLQQTTLISQSSLEKNGSNKTPNNSLGPSKIAHKLILNQDHTQIAVIWENQLGFSIFDTQSYKLVYRWESLHEITHFSMLYRTLQYALITKNRPNQVDFYDRGKKVYSQMFNTQVKDMSIINKHYQSFALKSQIYLYKKRELFDCIKTSDNEKGLYSYATFQADDLRLILATLSEKSRCSIQVKDFSFKSDYQIENIFGDNQEKQEHQIGDILIDDFGERLFVVNFQGIFLKTYSISDLRTNTTSTQATQQFRRGANPCLNFGRLQILRIEISKSEPDVEIGVLGGDSGTIHFFRLKHFTQEVQDIDTVEEESKFSEFFRKLKDKVLPSLLTFESSQLKIRLDKETTLKNPYVIFPSSDPTMINVVTNTGFNLKYSIDNILTQEENQKIAPQQYRTSSSMSNFNKRASKEQPSKEQQTNLEGVLRMKFKIKDFTEFDQANNAPGESNFNNISQFRKQSDYNGEKIDQFQIYGNSSEKQINDDFFESYESMTFSQIGIVQPDS